MRGEGVLGARCCDRSGQLCVPASVCFGKTTKHALGSGENATNPGEEKGRDGAQKVSGGGRGHTDAWLWIWAGLHTFRVARRLQTLQHAHSVQVEDADLLLQDHDESVTHMDSVNVCVGPGNPQ